MALSAKERAYLSTLVCGWCDQKLSAERCGDIWCKVGCDITKLQKAALNAATHPTAAAACVRSPQ
jgi:hypothetical protein